MEPTPKQKKEPGEGQVRRRAVDYRAVIKQIEEQVFRYTTKPLFHYVMTERLYRMPHTWGYWVRDNHEKFENRFAALEKMCAPLLRSSGEVAKAKRKAREVIVALLLVVHRKFKAQTPREVWRRILGHVNEEECEL